MSRLRQLFNWIDHRSGIKQLTHEALYENVPGGARWRYVWGSALTIALMIQFITGIFLWMAYSPGTQTAWASVYYIQHEMTGGWLLRGIHHFTAQLMTVLLVLHLMQVLIDGAYKAPRELNFWFGLVLLLLTLGLSLTGYLLPWDQKGFWATKVATNIMAITPVIGPALQKLVVGGADYGHHTLTRFFALHAGVIPGLIIAALVAHIYLFRKHGLTEAKRRAGRRRPDVKFWPDQVLKDVVAGLAVLAAVLFLTIFLGGADLGAPADPSEPYSAARPEWYFLFLFQLLKYFPGHAAEVFGAIILPGLVLAVMFAMPFIGKWRLGHRFNIVFTCAILAGAGLLAWLAKREDGNNPTYLAAVQQAEHDAKRVVELAKARGIPESGAATLLRQDARTQGPRLFAKNCASCHRYGGHDGLGQLVSDPQSAPDLQGFASRAWLAALLDPEQYARSNWFGGTKLKDGKMAGFLNKKVAKYDDAEKAQLVKVIAALSAEAALPAQVAADARDAGLIAAGREHLRADLACTDCHQFQKPDEDATAPDLTGYGSRAWLVAFLANPAHERFYGKKNDRMPRFGEDKVLTPAQLELLASWLRGEE